MRPPSWFLWAALVVCVAVASAALSSLEPPEPLAAAEAGDGFSAERAWPLLERLVADVGRHPVGTTAHEEVRRRIVAELEGLGYSPLQQEAFVCSDRYPECGHVTNLLARLPGRGGEEAVLVTAHYDSAGAGPGVADDMAGVAIILEAARLLEAEGLRNPVIFLLSDGEESGLLGANAFLEHPWAQDVGVVVNIEARGSSGQSLLFETSAGNERLIAEFAANVRRPVTNSLLYEMYRLLPNDTDLSVYLDAGLPGVNFAFAEEVAHYHTTLDDLQHLDPASFQHQGENVLGAVRAYAAMDLSRAVSGQIVYLDLFPGVLVRWPQEWTLPFSLALVALWFVLAAFLIRRRLVTLGSLLLGLSAAVLAPLLAALLGWGVTSGILLLSPAQEPWHAFPVATRVAIWSVAALAVLLPPLLLGRWLHAWSSLAGVGLLLSLLAAVTAWTVPGASFMFVVPALAVSVAALVSVLTDGAQRSASAGVSSLVALVASGWLWFGIALSVESGLGLDMGAAIAACVALAVVPVLPLVGPGTQGARSLALLAPLVTLGGVSAALLLPAYSEWRPQRLSLIHMQEEAAARWLLDGGWSSPDAAMAEVPPELLEVAEFEPATRAWRGATYLAAPATVIDEPAPGIELLEVEASEGGRRLRVRLASPRDGEMLTLYSRSDAFLSHIDFPQHGESVVPAWSGEGYARFSCHGRQCSGVEAVLHYSGTDPVELVLEDLVFRSPPAAQGLTEARPATAVPSWDGDVGILVSRLQVE